MDKLIEKGITSSPYDPNLLGYKRATKKITKRSNEKKI